MDKYRRRVVDSELDELMVQLPAIAIEGAKAVGKTATAIRRAASVRRLDSPGPRELMAADVTRGMRGLAPLLIDEWQYLPEIWDRVRRAVDDGAPAGSFLLTGSASLADSGTHSGGGRIVRVRMRPLALAERVGAAEPTVSLGTLLAGAKPPIVGSTTRDLAFYATEIVRSGFPGIRGLADRARRAQLRGYVDRVIDRDFPEFGRNLRRPDALRRWMASYAAATATTANFETIRDASTGGQGDKPAKTATTPYRDILERLFILDPLPGWQPSHNHIAQLGLAPKHHLADPALATILLGMREETLLDAGDPRALTSSGEPLLGNLFESLVALSVRVYAQQHEARVSHLRTHRGLHEVDLIVERADGAVLAIEVKLAADVEGDTFPHLKWLGAQIGSRLLDSVVVTSGTDAFRRKDGIAVVPAALLGP